MTTYTATVTRDDDLWAVTIAGLPKGVVGAADYQSFREIRDEVPWLIADLTDSERSEFDIEWRYELGGRDVTEQLQAMIATTERLFQVQVDQENARRAALEAMHQAGLSQRTIADAMGISHQRVNQILRHAG